MYIFAAETIDYIALRRLQDAYADIASRRAWNELHEIFLPEVTVSVDRRTGSPLEMTGPTAVGEFIGNAIAHMDFFEFVILNTRIFLNHDGDPDKAAARMYINELRHDRDAGRFTHAYGIYHDVYQRRDDRWWFAQRRYSSLARTGRDAEVFDFPAGNMF
jgi:SnoaL-like domain